MPSSFRIPKARLGGPYAGVITGVSRRMVGQVPDNLYVMWHNRPVLRALLSFENKVRKWKALNPHLEAYAVMASAGTIGCSWCMDFGYFMSHTKGLDLAKLREVPLAVTSTS